MSPKYKQNDCKISVSGYELAELKRHVYQIPECPGLDKRIQKYKGDKPFNLTHEELGWLVAVLNAVLNDPNGYPCIEHNPWDLKYVPKSDPLYATCKQLYDRLREEDDRIQNLIIKRAREYYDQEAQMDI